VTPPDPADSESDLAADLAGLVAAVLELEAGAVTASTRAEDLESWDSLGHVRIVMALEARYAVALSMDEIARADGIETLAAAVARARGR